MISSQEISYPLSNLTRNISDNSSDNSTSNKIKYLMKQNLDDVKIIKHDKSGARDIPIMCNKSVEVLFFVCPTSFYYMNCQLYLPTIYQKNKIISLNK